MNKIVELLVDWDNLEFDDLGVDIMSLVESPAIQIGWQAFSEEQFESYNDYPEAAKNNAQRALDWAEENGWGSCGEATGKRRANQLAKGEKITEDTIARMASFARHRQNSKTPYSEGCGKLMWDAWGGTAGIEWAQSKLKQIREDFSDSYQGAILELCQQDDFGTVYDPEEIKIIDLNKKEFADVSEVLGGLEALDALGNLLPETEGEIMYRYTGRLQANSRTFCRTMIGLNKMYTPTELATIGNLAASASRSLYPQTSRVNQDGTVSGGIGEWMGGPNCGHYWQKLEVFPNGIVNDLGRATGAMGRTMDSLSNNGYRMSWSFSEDDQMIITGPAMIPNSLIARKDQLGNTFHVYFSQDTIKKIAQKFLANADNNNTDINHDDNVTNENTLLESWIVENPQIDKAKTLGYNIPSGTWMVSYKINNKETWNKIKSGELNGYSVTGNFLEKLIK